MQKEQYYFDADNLVFYPKSLESSYKNVDFSKMTPVEQDVFNAMTNTNQQLSADSEGKPFLLPPSPSDYHAWDGQKWTLNDDKLTASKIAKWQAIKSHRDMLRHQGVKVGEKWYHSDESSRLQYITLLGLPQLPQNLMWKTMDETFITMTKEILQNIAAQGIIAETQNFANAERHRQIMMESDDPLNYDFSNGWAEVYQNSEVAL